MKTSFNKGFAWLPLLIILGLVILGGGAYWYKSQELKPNGYYDKILPQASTTSAAQIKTNTPAQTQTNISTSETVFVTFSNPKAGGAVSISGGTVVSWQPISATLQNKFKGFSLALEILDDSGAIIGYIGDGYSLNETSAQWNIKSHMDDKFYTLIPGKRYKLRADLGYFGPTSLSMGCDPAMPYGPKDCAPWYSDETKALIKESKLYTSDSEYFVAVQ